jgi:Spy/CpxP family protein refolding chaperone
MPAKGKKQTEEAKLKIGNAFKGIKLSEEHKDKIRKSMTGKKHSEETIKLMSEKRKLYWSNKCVL